MINEIRALCFPEHRPNEKKKGNYWLVFALKALCIVMSPINFRYG